MRLALNSIYTEAVQNDEANAPMERLFFILSEYLTIVVDVNYSRYIPNNTELQTMTKLIVNADLSNAPSSMKSYLKDLKELFLTHAANDNERGMDRVESHLNALMIGNAAGLCLVWSLEA